MIWYTVKFNNWQTKGPGKYTSIVDKPSTILTITLIVISRTEHTYNHEKTRGNHWPTYILLLPLKKYQSRNSNS